MLITRFHALHTDHHVCNLQPGGNPQTSFLAGQPPLPSQPPPPQLYQVQFLLLWKIWLCCIEVYVFAFPKKLMLVSSQFYLCLMIVRKELDVGGAMRNHNLYCCHHKSSSCGRSIHKLHTGSNIDLTYWSITCWWLLNNVEFQYLMTYDQNVLRIFFKSNLALIWICRTILNRSYVYCLARFYWCFPFYNYHLAFSSDY